MDVSQITTVIGTLGFPIAACCYLFYYLNKERESHKEEIDGIKNVINENNKILEALKILLESIERRLDKDD